MESATVKRPKIDRFMFSQKLKASIVKVNVKFENEKVKSEIIVLGCHKSKTSNENVKYQNLKLPFSR